MFIIHLGLINDFRLIRGLINDGSLALQRETTMMEVDRVRPNSYYQGWELS